MINQISIDATCKNEIENAADNGLTYYCHSNCIDNNLMGNGYIEGPVYAGDPYQCVLITGSNNGSSSYNISDLIIPKNGIIVY